MESLLTGGIEVVQNSLQGVIDRQRIFLLVRFKLAHRCIIGMATDEIEALERTHRSGTHSDDMSEVRLDMCNRLTGHGDDLRVHGMLIGIGRLNRQERTRTHMERHLIGLDTAGMQVCQYFLCKMQSCRRCCHTALDTRINGLVGLQIALFGLTVEVRRDRQFAGCIEYLGKRHILFIPRKTHGEGITQNLLFIGTKNYL